MKTAFILRFEEIVAEGACGAVLEAAGTQTMTRVNAEGSDADPGVNSVSALPREVFTSSGTQTMTNVRAESSDQDREKWLIMAIPRVCSVS